MTEYIIMVLGMAVFTYLPRMIPMVVLPGLKLPAFWERFLNFVPVAVLSALIFPGILYSTDSFLTTLLGGIVAVLLAWKKFNLMFVVLGSIGAAFFVSFI